MKKGIDKQSGRVLVEVDPRFFRPAEGRTPFRRQYQSQNKTGLETHYDLAALVKEMVAEDLKLAKKEKAFER